MDKCIKKCLLSFDFLLLYEFFEIHLGDRSLTPSPAWSMLCKCGMEPPQFNWFRACARIYYSSSYIHCNSPSSTKIVLRAEISLSSRISSCWTSYLLFATNGVHHAHGFQQKMRSANPLDSSQLVVDLRSRHLAYNFPYHNHHPQDLKRKTFTYHHWCALPTKYVHVTYSTFSPYLYQDFPES
eukprot:1149571-Pelagomonas_calceolata.AAC.3